MSDKNNTSGTDNEEDGFNEFGRAKRRKVYERVSETVIPDEVHEHFKKEGYDLRLVRYVIRGVEEYSRLSRREREGYEFVTKKELPDFYKKVVREVNSSIAKGMVTINDLVLMKIDTDLRNSRRDYFRKLTDDQINAVNINVLKSKGFRDTGTKSKLITRREPTFDD